MRERIDEENVVGFLTNSGEGAKKAYRERAEIAQKKGIRLVVVECTGRNLSNISSGEDINCRYWNGKSIVEALAPIPKVYYDRTGMRSISRLKHAEIMSALQERGCIFVNSPSFRDMCADKWAIYQIFDQNEILTPETHLYSENDLEDLLVRKGFVFIKRRSSSEGKRQIVIKEKSHGRFTISAGNNPVFEVKDEKKVFEYLGRKKGIDERCIVQEGIETDSIDNRVYDFRALFQRGGRGTMGLTAFYVRVGAKKSNQANIGKGGHPQDPYVMFEDYKKVRGDILSMGKKVIRAFSKAYVVGEVGLDFIYDSEGKLYAIEANTKAGSKGFRTLREWVPTDRDYRNKDVIPFRYNNRIRALWGDRLETFLTKPLIYAKYLNQTHIVESGLADICADNSSE